MNSRHIGASLQSLAFGGRVFQGVRPGSVFEIEASERLIRKLDGNFLATILGFDLDAEIDTAVP